jgi:hypothetical protein
MGTHIWNCKVCVVLVQELACWMMNSVMTAVRELTYRLNIFSCVLGEKSRTMLEVLLYLYWAIRSTFLLAHGKEARLLDQKFCSTYDIKLCANGSRSPLQG